MKYPGIPYLLFVLLNVYQINILSQTHNIQNITAPPNASNFAYPQSVFVDSYNGHIWVTDFDNNRVLRFDVSTLNAIDELKSPGVINGYFLSQNYPNPFNSGTQIVFYTSTSGNAQVEVFNIIGQKIASLFNSSVTADRIYTITFDGRDLPSGIYIYSLRTQNGSEIKKMCLLK